jgi:diamine N-acetyltransferase
LQVREATVADLHALHALAVQVFTVTFENTTSPEDFKTFMNDTYTLEKMEAEFSDVGAIYFVAEEDGALAGYARVRESDEVDYLLGNNHLELQRLYADVAWQGKGVAKLLMDACEQVALDRGKDWIWLGVWEHNYKAQRFYQKHGYERFGDHVFMMGTDKQTDWLMRKRVVSGNH